MCIMNRDALSFNDKVSTYKILVGLNENKFKKKVKVPSCQLKNPLMSTNINVILGPNFLLLTTSLNAT